MDLDKKRRHSDQDRDDNHYSRERKSKRARSRSRSPLERHVKSSTRKRGRSPSPLEVKKEMPERKNKDTDMLNTRTGGAYIPPARLRMMQKQITDKTSVAYQRLAWEALKKSVHGHINKINVGNIGIIIKQLLKENIVRGRGLFCRSVIQAQAASLTFTNVYAALISAVNSRFPNIGELLLKRLVVLFKRSFKRNDKPACISSATFIAHLVNQRVAHEIIALELLTLLVESPTDDSVEVAIAFLKECGQKLIEVCSKGVSAIFDMLRNILHEGQLDKRIQYMIEVIFQVWKDGFKDHPALIEELELVPEEDQFTHLVMLDDACDPQDILNVFKYDEKYEENEQKYKTLCEEILGSDAESDEDGSGESGSEESDEEEEQDQKPVTIIDNTETNLIALRRTIYLTINSSLDFEECAHKLMKMQLKPGQEVELCHMFLDCCAEQRTYVKFYGLLSERFCNINRVYIGSFEEIFKESYGTAHRLDTNRLRNVSKFFAHLLYTDSISWEVLECVKLNEEDTTSSGRIYIKILFQELAEYMGLKKLNDRLKDPTLQEAFSGIFPRDNPRNTRFSINFFTSIGLGGLTDELREHLKQMPKNVVPQVTEITVESSSDTSSSSSDSSSSDDSSDSSSSDSEDGQEKDKKKEKDKTKEDKSKVAEEAGPEVNKDRWGHDGFYDTYGKDARRHTADGNERDKDNFVRPRSVPWKNGNNGPRDRESHNHREDFRRDDGGSNRNRRTDSENDKELPSRNPEKNDDRRRDQRNSREDASRERSRQDRNRETDEDRRKYHHDSRDKASRYGSRRDERDENYERQEKSLKSNRKDTVVDDQERDREKRNKADNHRNSENDKNESRNKDSSSNLIRRDERDENYERQEKSLKSNRKDTVVDDQERDREKRNKADNHRNSENDKNESRNKDSSSNLIRRDERDENYERQEKSLKSNRKDTVVDDQERDREKRNKADNHRNSESDKNESRKKDNSSNKKALDKQRKGKYVEKSEGNSSSDDERTESRRDKGRKDIRSVVRSKEEDRNQDSSSNEEKIKKDKHKNKKGKRDKNEKKEESTDEDEAKSKHRKNKKKVKKTKKKSKDGKDKDSWDIRRASSVRREVTGRYWDKKDNRDYRDEFDLSNKL